MNIITLKGVVTIDGAIIDPYLPDALRDDWLCTGMLIHHKLRELYLTAYIEQITANGETLELDEAFNILSGRQVYVNDKRKTFGRHQDLLSRSKGLCLFGNLTHKIKGNLNVGFVKKQSPDKYNNKITIVNPKGFELSLLQDLFVRWSKNPCIGDNTNYGFGTIKGAWDVYDSNGKIIAEISL